jgi:hypothetical protein
MSRPAIRPTQRLIQGLLAASDSHLTLSSQQIPGQSLNHPSPSTSFPVHWVAINFSFNATQFQLLTTSPSKPYIYKQIPQSLTVAPSHTCGCWLVLHCSEYHTILTSTDNVTDWVKRPVHGILRLILPIVPTFTSIGISSWYWKQIVKEYYMFWRRKA